jgi:L-alanine-DL-glutamate epimerase-like enolase superfamily enzyme
MKVTEITTHMIKLDFTAWYEDRPKPDTEPRFWYYPLICLSTDEGIEGYSMGYGVVGCGHANASLIHDVYYHHVVGHDPLCHEAIWQNIRRLNRHLYGITDTIQAELDVALWDIKGKVAGLPIATLLGKVRDKVPLYASLPPHLIETPEALEKSVKAKKAAGYSGIKLQPLGGPASVIPRLHLAREIVGPDFPLMIDSSAELTFVEALAIGRELDTLKYLWFEEPIPDRQINQLKKLADDIETPVLAAETVRLHELPQYLIQGALDIARGDVHLKGGITGLCKALAMCELMGYELEIHTAASPIIDVANLHVACASELSRFVEAHHPIFRFAIKDNPLEVDEDGYQRLPQKPGLGIELDWDWIDDNTEKVIKGYTSA